MSRPRTKATINSIRLNPALEADLPDAQHQQVRLIADSGRAMLRLLNDILDLARIEAGQLRLVPEAGKLEFRVKGPQVSPGYLPADSLAQMIDQVRKDGGCKLC